MIYWADLMIWCRSSLSSGSSYTQCSHVWGHSMLCGSSSLSLFRVQLKETSPETGNRLSSWGFSAFALNSHKNSPPHSELGCSVLCWFEFTKHLKKNKYNILHAPQHYPLHRVEQKGTKLACSLCVMLTHHALCVLCLNSQIQVLAHFFNPGDVADDTKITTRSLTFISEKSCFSPHRTDSLWSRKRLKLTVVKRKDWFGATAPM